MRNENGAMPMAQQHYANCMKPVNITVKDKRKQSQETVFPWAVATKGEEHTKIQLLKNTFAASTEEKIMASVQHLEYAVAEAVYKVTTEKSKKIAIIKGIGEPDDKIGRASCRERVKMTEWG